MRFGSSVIFSKLNHGPSNCLSVYLLIDAIKDMRARAKTKRETAVMFANVCERDSWMYCMHVCVYECLQNVSCKQREGVCVYGAVTEGHTLKAATLRGILRWRGAYCVPI